MDELPFSDLHSFKDFVTYVQLCSPDNFSQEDYLEPHEQITLENAFEGLRCCMDIFAKEIGNAPLVDRCRILIEEAYGSYVVGNVREGYNKMEALEKIIDQLPSQ